jgi:hypothetical protein
MSLFFYLNHRRKTSSIIQLIGLVQQLRMLGLDDTLLHNTDNNKLPQKRMLILSVTGSSPDEIKHALPLFTFLKKA